MKITQQLTQQTCLLVLLLLCLCGACTAQNNTGVLIKIDGAIGPATADFMGKGFTSAEQQGASLIIIQMDTPGGLDQAMRDIIKDIINSPIPVVTYVAPSGARAASAGTYILLASHVAAMAPGTNLGAATPVSIGGVPDPGKGEDNPLRQGDKDKNDKTPKQTDDMTQKMKKDATAYIESLAELHGRNAKWARKAVLDADSIPASQALKLGVIEYISPNLDSLLKDINNSEVKVQGNMVKINTDGMVLNTFEPDWRIKFLSIITNPSVAYILMLIGIYGIFFEFLNPGFVLPGVVGAICLLLALYALQMLPISYVGLGLILLGVAFMVAEVFMPSFGVLGIGGLVAFAVGSVMLIDTQLPGYGIPWTMILIVCIVNALFFFMVLGMAVRAKQRPQVIGRGMLVGHQGHILEDAQQQGWVIVEGEQWRCTFEGEMKAGQAVTIVDEDNMVLSVKSKDSN